MKNLTKLTLAAILSLTVSVSGFSQAALKKANAAFEANNFFRAIELYKTAYSGVPKEKRALVLYRQGVASARINNYSNAENYFYKAIEAGCDVPEVYYELAQVLKALSKYPDAITQYNAYKSKGGDAKRADIGVKSCELSQTWVDNPMRYKIENIALVNSKGRDFAPCFSDKKYQTLILTSNRDGSLGGTEIIRVVITPIFLKLSWIKTENGPLR
jgi:tetratricopeptide (TPR) repeat protein